MGSLTQPDGPIQEYLLSGGAHGQRGRVLNPTPSKGLVTVPGFCLHNTPKACFLKQGAGLTQL